MLDTVMIMPIANKKQKMKAIHITDKRVNTKKASNGLLFMLLMLCNPSIFKEIKMKILKLINNFLERAISRHEKDINESIKSNEWKD